MTEKESIPTVCPKCGHKLRHVNAVDLCGIYFVYCQASQALKACRWCAEYIISLEKHDINRLKKPSELLAEFAQNQKNKGRFEDTSVFNALFKGKVGYSRGQTVLKTEKKEQLKSAPLEDFLL